MIDYYETLGVSRDATPEQLKKAYRRMAMQYHPDVATEEGAADKFKAVQEAYDVLSDPNKRAIYDRGGDPSGRGGGFGGGGFEGFGAQGFDFTNLVDAMFGGGGGARGPRSRVRRGQDAMVRLRLDLHEAAFGTTKHVRVDTAVLCPKCSGTGAQEGSKPQTCGTCQGRGDVVSVQRSFLGDIRTSQPCPACRGYGSIIPHPCVECDGDGRIRASREVTVKVPAGVSGNHRMRLAHQGEVGPGGGDAGDLYVELMVAEHPVFKRNGDDLEMVVKIPMTAAALGTTVEVRTLEADWEGSEEEDRLVSVEVPAGTQSGTRIALEGRGITGIDTGRPGDLGITFLVQTPTKTTEEQRELLRRLAELRDETSIDVQGQKRDKGMFGRFREAFK
ncbi:molecular chaperone DnaJ [Mariniluteicoccus flavus]